MVSSQVCKIFVCFLSFVDVLGQAKALGVNIKKKKSDKNKSLTLGNFNPFGKSKLRLKKL